MSAAYETEHGAAGQEPWRSVLLLSALPLFSFYGRRHVNHHLTLLGLLMIFLLGERLTDLLSGTDEHREYAKWWSYLAPAVNLLAGWWLLHDRQLERVVSGVADDFELVRRQRGEPRELRGARGAFSFAGLELEGTIRLRSEEAHDATSVVERYVTLVDLAPHVAADLALELPAISGLAAAATLVELEWSVPDTAHPRIVALAATVVDGKLELIVTARADARARGRRRRLLRTLRVAWLVDLDIPRTPADRSLL